MRALLTRRPSWSVTSQSTTLVVLPCRRTRASALISPCSTASRKLIFISIVTTREPWRGRQEGREASGRVGQHRHDAAVDHAVNLLVQIEHRHAEDGPAALGLHQLESKVVDRDCCGAGVRPLAPGRLWTIFLAASWCSRALSQHLSSSLSTPQNVVTPEPRLASNMRNIWVGPRSGNLAFRRGACNRFSVLFETVFVRLLPSGNFAGRLFHRAPL